MDGLEAVEMKLSTVLSSTETVRFDSEYYRKKYILHENTIKRRQSNFKKFETLGLIVDGSAFYPALEPYYGEGNFPFVRVADVKDIVDFENCEKVPESILPNFPTLKLVKYGDIILTKGGTVAKAGLITKDACVSRDLIFINSSVLNERDYISLFLYLSTSFAYDLLIRSASQSVQPHLTITLVRDLDMFEGSKHFKNALYEIFMFSQTQGNQSKALYTSAENILLSELGLTNWQPTEANTEVKTFAQSFASSGRLDAEYYQPKYDEVENAILDNSLYHKRISDFKSFNARGLQPEYFEEGNLQVINSKHILDKTLDYGNFEKTDITYWDKQERARVFKEDILTYTTGANIGRTSVYLIDEKALASNHVNILRVKGEDPVYVAFVMNSILGRLQTEKLSAGSAQQELYPKDIDNFLIPFIDKKFQVEIRNAVLKSLELQQQCHRLLEAAKQAVEMAIEEGEGKAMGWLKKQTNT